MCLKKDCILVKKFYAITVKKSIIIMLCCISIGHMFGVTSNLLSLLNVKPSVPKQSPITVGVKSSPIGSGSSSTQTVATPGSSLEGLFASSMSKLENSDYQAALKILNDVALNLAYQRTVMNLQLFFLQYSTQVLQKYFVQAAKSEKIIPLTSLLQLSSASLTKSSDTHALSNLVALLQTNASHATSSTIAHVVQTSLIRLLQKATPVPAAQPVTHASLLSLLSSSQSSKGNV